VTGWRTTNCTVLQRSRSLPAKFPDTSRHRQAMIDEFDLDQDGEINEQEFFAIMTDET